MIGKPLPMVDAPGKSAGDCRTLQNASRQLVIAIGDRFYSQWAMEQDQHSSAFKIGQNSVYPNDLKRGKDFRTYRELLER